MNFVTLTSIRLIVRHTATAALVAAAMTTAAVSATAVRDAAPPLPDINYSGSQSALMALDAEISAARQEPAKLAAIADRLVGIIRDAESTFAARQAACQRLGLVLQAVPGPEFDRALRILRPLLTNERDVDLARLALEPLPGPAVDDVFVEALDTSSGRARVGLIQALGARRATAAVPALGKLMEDATPDVAAAAIAALGEIGAPAAMSVLEKAPPAHAMEAVRARLAAAARAASPEAESTLARIQDDAAVPPALRAAALRIRLASDREAAGRKVAAVLRGTEWIMKEAALDAAADLPAAGVVPELAGAFPDFDPPTRVAALSLFARMRDAAAVPVTMQASTDNRPEVRAAAVQALGFLPGSAEVAGLLAKVASDSANPNAKVARESLARLTGSGVAETILSGARKGEAALRATFLGQLALRGATDAVPILVDARGDPDARIRSAAVAALGDLGSMEQQPVLIEWATGAQDEGEQSNALRALVDLTLRDPSIETRGAAIYAALEKAAPEIALRLLPALQRLGGVAGAACAARLAVGGSAALAEAAAGALTRWPDHTALPSLAQVSETAAIPGVRQTALEGALRHLERNRDPWSPATTQIVSRLVSAAPDTESRSRLLEILGRASDRKAISVANLAGRDPKLAARAREVTEVIRANLAGSPAVRTSSNAENAPHLVDGKTNTRWNVAAREGEWLEIEFRRTRPIRRVTLEQGGRADEFPERYEVHVSDDRRQPGAVLASGTGQRGRTIIELPAGTRGRCVIVKNTADRADSQWSVFELYVD